MNATRKGHLCIATRLRALLSASLGAALLAALGSVLSAQAANVTWNLNTGNAGDWDTTTANWTGEATVYTEGDNATFLTPNNVGSAPWLFTVNVVPNPVTPGSLTINSSANLQFYLHWYWQSGNRTMWNFTNNTFGSSSTPAGALTNSGSGVAFFRANSDHYFRSVTLKNGVTIFAPSVPGSYAFGKTNTTAVPITLDGGTFNFWPVDNGYVLVNPFIVTNSGGLATSLGTNKTVVLGGPIQLHGNLRVENPNNSLNEWDDRTTTLAVTGVVTMTGSRTISVEGRARDGCRSSAALVISNNISGAGKLTLTPKIGMPLAGSGTHAWGAGLGWVRSAYVALYGDNTGLTGGMEINGGGHVIFRGGNTVLGGGGPGSILISNAVAIIDYPTFAAGNLAIFNTNSTGALALDQNSSVNIDLTGFNEGLRFGPGRANPTYSGTLTPQSDTYWLGGGVGALQGFTVPTMNFDGNLTGARNLDVGTPTACAGIFNIRLRGAGNTYSGYTKVSGGNQLLVQNSSIAASTSILLRADCLRGFFTRTQRVGSALTFEASALNNRIGDNTPITLNGGTLAYYGINSAHNLEIVGPIRLQGHGQLTVFAGAGYTATLQADALLRQNAQGNTSRGTAHFGNTTAGGYGIAGNTARYLFDTPPTLVGGGGADGSTTISIIPFAIGNQGSFLGMVTYDPTYGVRPLVRATEYASSIVSGDITTNNVLITSGNVTLTGGTFSQINSLVVDTTGGSLYAGGPGTVLRVASGAILLNQGGYTLGNNGVGATNLTFDFGGAEGVVNAGGTYCVLVARFSGTNGITFSGVNDSSVFYQDRNFSVAGVVGPVTINNGWMTGSGNAPNCFINHVVVVNGLGIFHTGNTTQTVTGLEGDGAVVAMSGAWIFDTDSGNYVFDGDFVEDVREAETYGGYRDGTIEKKGAGSQTLNGDIRWGGQVWVNGGKLVINGTLASGLNASKTLFVTNGATLGGCGRISRDVGLGSGATLDLSNSNGTLTIVGNLTMTNAVLNLGLAPTNGITSVVSASGNITCVGPTTLNLTAPAGVALGFYSYDLLACGGTLSGGGNVVLGAVSAPNNYKFSLDTGTPGKVKLQLAVLPQGTMIHIR